MARHRVLFGWEPCRILFAEPNLSDLLREHHEELGVHKDQMPLDPDWQRFIQLEDAGLFRIWAGRTEGGLLVAYLAFFIQPHLHYRQTLTAVEDLFMVSAPYRRGWTGVRLFTTALEALKALGVKRVILHDKVHFSAEREGGGLEILFNRLGFLHTDRIWSRML